MNFIPENLTIRNLIKTYPTFKIPIFQRDYSWEEQYYSRFIDDIIEAITLDNKSQLISRNYFLGTMVFSNNTQKQQIIAQLNEYVMTQQQVSEYLNVKSKLSKDRKLEPFHKLPNGKQHLNLYYKSDVDKYKKYLDAIRENRNN